MLWDFADANPFSSSAGNWVDAALLVATSIARLPASVRATAAQRDASSATQQAAICTDPPYYDNVPYADLADFFYIWLRQALKGLHGELVGTVLTPKADELVADPFRHGGGQAADEFFERGFENVFHNLANIAITGVPLTVFYAFKQSERESETGSVASTGWEKMLEGMLRSGWAITGTWPMRTEWGNRLRNLESNALASSIVLVCRPRSASAGATDRRGLQTALLRELPDALRELQQGLIAPVDLAQASIGPGMAVFSSYAKVVEPDGSAMTVRTALGHQPGSRSGADRAGGRVRPRDAVGGEVVRAARLRRGPLRHR